MIGSSVNHNLNAFYLNGGSTAKGDVLPDYSGRSYTSPVSSFGWLNPGDIASIEVIKDLSAAALYGMSGANGVIVIKTKRTSSTARNIYFRRMSASISPPKRGMLSEPASTMCTS